MTCAVLMAVVGAGCGQGKPASTSKPSDGTPVVEPTPKAVPSTPEAAHAALAKALGENRAEAWFDALPPRYQAELNATYQSVVEETDDEVWTRGIETLRKGLRLLREKHDLVSSHPLLAERVDLEKHWDDLIAILATPLEGDTFELARLRKSSLRELLAGPLSQLLTRYAAMSKKSESDPYGSFVKRMQSQQAQLVRREGSDAWLRIVTPGEPDKEEKWVRIDEHWVPESLVLGWTRRMGELRKTFGVGTFRKGKGGGEPDWKEATLARMDDWNNDLDELLALDDPGTFHARFTERVLGPLFAAPLAMSSDDEGAPAGGVVTADGQDAPPARKPAPTVTTSAFVVVQGPLDADARDAWEKRLSAASDAPDYSICIPATQGNATRFEVNPVGDVAAFAKRLAEVKIVSVDEQSRTVTVEPGKP
ncbi:MAG: hypothetical protein IT428_03210 [Planctomycetaceae bacterium]|nr:hypothetical protein [Planctomycetaceae bacterium]